MPPDPISAPDLANAVTAYATILSGLTTLALTALVRRQPLRWAAVYAGIVLTGIPTVWYHGYGETFWAGVADSGTNLLLAWLMQVAVLGDYYSPRTRWIVGGVSGLINAAAMIPKLALGAGYSQVYVVPLGAFGGFHIAEAVLIADSLFAVGLLYFRHRWIPQRARPLLYVVTAVFVFGTLLATASNQQVDFRILAYHATWHVVGAFGFILLWAFNQVRAEEGDFTARRSLPPM